jgi:DNA replication protein DnaC
VTATATSAAQTSESVKQIIHLATALKAPRITEAAARLADQARDAGWTHEDYLAAVLEREVSARNASGAQLRIRAAGSARSRPSRTSTSTPNQPSGNKSGPWPPAGS